MPRTRERGDLVVAPSQSSLDAPAPGGIPRGTGTAAAAAMAPEPSLVLGGTAIFLVGRTDVPRVGTHRKEDEEAGTVLRRSVLARHGTAVGSERDGKTTVETERAGQIGGKRKRSAWNVLRSMPGENQREKIQKEVLPGTRAEPR